MNEAIHRKQPAHWIPDPDHPSVIVFVTCCTKNRRPCLHRDEVKAALCAAWLSAAQWRVGRYVVMPDHIHLFCAPTADAEPLQKWMGYWRSLTTRALGEAKGALWQREFWDRQLRRQESYAEKWEYVRYNPVRAGLADSPDDWPYQGELHCLEWIADSR